ncbi:type II toxin-antitoxin system RelE/ParE family toxin [bacterium]|jgi:mRNA interferase RelE/StbE|nr:type II toxin-antitoxin system RelE/ParE family toxin [bacterium]
MSYGIRYEKAAARSLKKLPVDAQRGIVSAIKELAKDPANKANVKKLKNSDFYRVRIRDYRVIYELDAADKVITINSIFHRQKGY